MFPGEVHLDIAIHVATGVPCHGKRAALTIVDKHGQQIGLHNVLLLQLFATGVHDLEIMIEIGSFRDFDPKQLDPLERLSKPTLVILLVMIALGLEMVTYGTQANQKGGRLLFLALITILPGEARVKL